MGLDAVVYFNLDNFRGVQDKDLLRVDELTGEVYTDDPQAVARLAAKFSIAEEARLGSVSEIGILRKELQGRLDEKSILLGSILRSGSHSGDIIEVDALETLSEELRQVELDSKNSSSLLLREFILRLRGMIEEARRQQNPIVFV